MESANKKLIFLFAFIAIIFSNHNANAQFWIEDFFTVNSVPNGEANGYSGFNGTWTVTTLPGTTLPGQDENLFYISCEEAGMVAGNCGSNCPSPAPPPPSPFIGQSLHLGANWGGIFSLGDDGAIYNAGDGGSGIFDSSTELRVESPAISCVGHSGINLKFNYIEFGDGALDNAETWYSANGGVTWALLVDMPKTTCGNGTGGPCGVMPCNGMGEGIWATFTTPLPATADNNANVKIGFRWINNNDGVGTDPSFAVSHILVDTGNVAGTIGSDNVMVQESSIFPNPGNGDVTIVMPENMLHKTSKFIVYDAKGAEIKQGKITSLKTNIGLNECPKGLYVICIQSDETFNRHRYLKQ